MAEPGSTSGPSAPEIYDAAFYEFHREISRRSAAAIVPLFIDLFHPRSVVDIGCGGGQWLAAFRERGVADVLGLDGPWAGSAQRELPDACFREHDLTSALDLGRTFDLALCLEVAEHLPESNAEGLVWSLCTLAPVVAFSAAIPFQGGDGHVNEKWQSYWFERFAARGFAGVDVRPRFWTNEDVSFWYRQNLFCYVAKDRTDLLERLTAPGENPGTLHDVVHPKLYLQLRKECDGWRAGARWHAYKEKEIAGERDELLRSQAELTKELALERERREEAGRLLEAERAERNDAREQLRCRTQQLAAIQDRLKTIETSRAWRLIQTLRPVLDAALRLESFLRRR